MHNIKLQLVKMMDIHLWANSGNTALRHRKMQEYGCFGEQAAQVGLQKALSALKSQNIHLCLQDQSKIIFPAETGKHLAMARGIALKTSRIIMHIRQ